MKIKILKLISLHIDHITTYTRKYLLVYYYAIMMNLEVIPDRKRVYLIKSLRNFDKAKIKSLMTLKTSNLVKFNSNLIKMMKKYPINNNKCFKQLKKAIKCIII